MRYCFGVFVAGKERLGGTGECFVVEVCCMTVENDRVAFLI